MAGPNQSQAPKKSGGLQTYATIDTSSLERQLWLARVQPALFQLWDEAPEGTLLGTLTFTKGTPKPKAGGVNKNMNMMNRKMAARKGTNGGNNPRNPSNPGTNPTGKPAFQQPPQKPVQQRIGLKLSDEHLQSATNPQARDLPLDYTITNLTSKIPTLLPFTRTNSESNNNNTSISGNGTVQFHGTISRTCNLQIDRTDRYRNVCKKRILETVEKDRFVKPVATADLSMRSQQSRKGIGGNVGFGSNVATFGKQLQEAQKEFQNNSWNTGDLAASNKKRKFSETQSTKSILFELFSRRDYWTFKELKSASGGRNDAEIKLALKEICDFNRMGENKNMWALKKEYAGEAKKAATDATMGQA